MASALRADAPDFVPSFEAVSTSPPESRSNGPKAGPKRHQKGRKPKKQRSSRGCRRNQRKCTPSDDQRPEYAVKDDLRVEEGVACITSPTSFASILRRDTTTTSDASPTVPAGWTVLRPRKQQREFRSKGDAVGRPESRLTGNGPATTTSKETVRTTQLTERMSKLRRRLWETMDRMQQEKRIVEEEFPLKIQQDSCYFGMGVHDHVVVHNPHPNFTRTNPSPTQPPASFDLSLDFETMISQLQEGILPSFDEDYRCCLDVAVRLDRPAIVRLLCSRWVGSSYGTAKKKLQKQVNGCGGHQEIHPLLNAVALGHDECLQILLSSFPVGSICDTEGNTALHMAARRCNFETFRLVWKQQCQQTNKKKHHQATAFKFVSRRNRRGQTCLHVACENSATDIVDWILRRNEPRSLLSKLLLMEDEDTQTPLLAAIAAGATDCVMNFLMQGAAGVTGSQSCPLRWAVRSNSTASGVVEMVSLLLEFHGKDDAASSSVYNWHGTLCDCLARRDQADTETLSLQLLRLLVEAGGNPYANSASQPKKARAAQTVSDSVFWMAVGRYDADALDVMLETHDAVETRRREMRRKDPKLKQQPESFFVGMESSSNLEKRTNLRRALLVSLYHMQKATASSSKEKLTVVVLTLYKHGATLDETHLRLLKESLRQSTLILAESPCAVASLLQSSNCPPTTKAEGVSSDWKCALYSLPWFNCSSVGGYACNTISNVSGESCHQPFFARPRVLIKSHDKIEFLVHEEIFDEQCEKLAGAVRFAKASRPSGDSPVALEVGLTAIQCRWLLEHLYSNSILTPLPDSPVQCCDALLELCLVADEYLCWSLLQECEMRLLANYASFNVCHCWDCQSNAASCLYLLPTNVGAAGTVSSFLVNEQTVLNVLALVNELVDSSPAVLDEAYATTVRTYAGSWKKQPALRALSDLVTSYLLSHFGAVVKNAGWVSHICAPDDCDTTEEFGMLLNYCLEELNSR